MKFWKNALIVLGLVLASVGVAIAVNPPPYPALTLGGQNVPPVTLGFIDNNSIWQPVTAANPLPGAGGGGGGGASYNTEVVQTPTIGNTAHAAGSSVGGLLTLPFFRSTTQPSGIVNNVQWIWKSGGLQGVTVYLFNANPSASTCTDGTAVSVGAADIPKLLKGSPFVLSPSVIGSGATFAAGSSQLPISTKNADGVATVNLYGCVAINTAATTPANDGVFGISGPQD